MKNVYARTMYKTLSVFFVFILWTAFFSVKLHAQIGGNHTYDFLNLIHSARAASFGGDVIAVDDNDYNLTYHNPALLNDTMNHNLVINYVNYFTDINYGYVGYATTIKNRGIFSGGINYINYGQFTAADEKGIITGNFKAAEYAINLMYSKQIDSIFRVGVNVKPVISTLEKYTSLGLAFDIGAVYHKPGSLFSAALVLKNMGMQLKGYTNEKESLPFNIQLGISQKLKYAPLLFTVTFDHLENWSLTYDKPKEESALDPISGTETEESNLDKIADEFMRHVIIGVELNPLENFYLRAGYNYRRRQEMLIESKTSTIGFSWGFGVKISKFHISYGRATYHLAGATDHFSISTNLDSFKKNL